MNKKYLITLKRGQVFIEGYVKEYILTQFWCCSMSKKRRERRTCLNKVKLNQRDNCANWGSQIRVPEKKLYPVRQNFGAVHELTRQFVTKKQHL